MKNLVLTMLLSVLAFAVAYESANLGIFRMKRDLTAQNNATEPNLTAAAVDPTPTPLPIHFPAVENDDLSTSKTGSNGLIAAFKACWPEAPVTGEVPIKGLTLADVEKLFGKIGKQEVLEETHQGHHLGLLFDNTVFPGGAAGSAIEIDGSVQEFQARAAGRMLHCDDEAGCECLASLGP